MLSKDENRVMSTIYKICESKKTVLVSPIDLIKATNKDEITLNKLEKIMTALSQDGYFDLVYSDRHGEKIYCITILDKGKAFKRNGVVIKRNLLYKLCITVIFAFISFIIGIILKKIF